MDTHNDDPSSNNNNIVIAAAEAETRHHDGVMAEEEEHHHRHLMHEQDVEEDEEEERRTRIMELAQQQQMTIQLLDEVVANQRNLFQDNLEANRLRRRRTTRGGLQRNEEYEEHQQPILPRRRQQPHHNPHQQIINHQHREGGGGRRSLLNVTQIYFVVSALFAFLAVVTTFPLNIGMSISSYSSFPPFKLHYSLENNVVKGGDTTVATNHHKDDDDVEVVEKTGVNNIYGGGVVDDDVVVDNNNNYYQSKRHDTNGAVVGNGHTRHHHHQQRRRRSMKSSHSQRKHSHKKEKIITSSSSSSPSSEDLKWEELLIETFENIRDHYKEQYLILKNFWMYGTLTNLSDPTNSHYDEDPFPWSIFPWTWGKKSQMKEDDSDKLITLSKKKNGGIAKSNTFSLYSIAMDVIDPSPYNAATVKKVVSTADTSSLGASQNNNTGELEKKSSVSLAEKILSSTPRLIAIANLILALVYLFHAAVADLFLGTSMSNLSTIHHQQQDNIIADEQTRRQRRLGRERFGGYLLFKLLLISSVLDPGTEDLLILFSWYMLLSFLRSLAHLAGSTANHASQSGQSPRPGALHLLITVFICDIGAAAGCVVLFRGAGWHMLLLLTCDCALVAADAMAHIVKHCGLTMEERHRSRTSSLEEELANLRRRSRELLEQYRDELCLAESEYVNDTEFDISMLPIRRRSGLEHVDLEVARLEQEIEKRELVHMRRMKIADVAVFGFELSALTLTMAHFMHIWAWHGASFGLVDFVLALHLHSTISIIGKKIAERRSIYRIGVQLSSHFKDASDIDIRKASAAGDVCCICLNSMTIGNVKKVGCGHLFHTICLREVVERERSIHAARCPLCRASLITGGQMIVGGGTENNNIVNEDGQQAQPTAQMQNNPQLNPVDTSLLRFSTEGWLPSWIPVPAFSFEIVRRETPVVFDRNPNPGGWQRFFRRGGQLEANDDGTDAQEQQQQEGGNSFWRRLLILLGAVEMSPEEEAIALEQLVDMFPQYERSDLLRELRARRSAEAVVESVLLGVFSGVARGG